MNINESYKLAATVLPYTAKNLNPIWKSSDTSIVEIDGEGNVLPFVKSSSYNWRIKKLIKWTKVKQRKDVYPF